MNEQMIVIGYAAIGITFMFGLGEIHDAWKYSHHPDESVRKELKNWGVLLIVWILAVGLAHYI